MKCKDPKRMVGAIDPKGIFKNIFSKATRGNFRNKRAKDKAFSMLIHLHLDFKRFVEEEITRMVFIDVEGDFNDFAKVPEQLLKLIHDYSIVS